MRERPKSPDDYYRHGTLLVVEAEPAGDLPFLSWRPLRTALCDSMQPGSSARFQNAPGALLESSIPGAAILVEGERVITPHRAACPPGSMHEIATEEVHTFDYFPSLRFLGWGDSPETGSVRTYVVFEDGLDQARMQYQLQNALIVRASLGGRVVTHGSVDYGRSEAVHARFSRLHPKQIVEKRRPQFPR